jgi:DNA ligase-1
MKASQFRPMTAARQPKDMPSDEYIETCLKPHLPLLASKKKDGIRCVVFSGQSYSRVMKPIPNRYVQGLLRFYYAQGALKHNITDGELVACDSSGHDLPYNTTQSLMMTEDTGSFKFRYYTFDFYSFQGKTFGNRHPELQRLGTVDKLSALEQFDVTRVEDLYSMLENTEEEGYILRRADSKYKMGRATLREGGMMKLVSWLTDEAKILQLNESQENCNAQSTNEIGLSVRLGGASNHVGKGELGSFSCKQGSMVFNVSCSTMPRAMKLHAWEHPEEWLGKTLTYKHKPFGRKELPRQAQYKSLRLID